MVKGGRLPKTGEWTCSNCGKTDCWSTRYSCYRCGVPQYFDGSGMGQGLFRAGPGKGGGMPGLEGQGVGAGMGGVRLVGALRRDQTYVSTENPTHRKGNGERGAGGASAWCGRGKQGGAGRVGLEGSGAAPKGQGKTQRDLILEAVEALKGLLGQGVFRSIPFHRKLKQLFFLF